MSNSELKYSSEMMINEDCLKIILNNRFKHRDTLFITLHEMGRMSHNNLAVQLGISSSGLNAVIHKANSQGIETISEEQQGRNKYYSLTAEAETFTRKYLLSVIVHKNEQTYIRDNGIENFSMPLQRFKRVAGEDWEIILDDCLTGKESRITISRHDEVAEAFYSFCNDIKLQIMEGTENEMERIKKAVGSNILAYRLEEYFHTEFFEFENLSVLCELYERNQEDAFNFIDELCQGGTIGENARSIVKSRKYIKMGIQNAESVFTTANILEGMFSEAKKCTLTKEEFKQDWKKKFPARYKGLIHYLSKNVG